MTAFNLDQYPTRVVGIRHRIKFTREGKPSPTVVALQMMGKKKVTTFELEDEDAELDWTLTNFPVEFEKVEDPTKDLTGFLVRHIKWKKVKKDTDYSGHHRSQLLIEKQDRVITQVLIGEEGGKQSYRKVAIDEDVSEFRSDETRYKSRKVKPGENLSDRHQSQVFTIEVGEPTHFADKIPTVYDGLKPGDHVVMMLGGSGDPFAYALSRKSDDMTKTSGKHTGVYRLPPAVFKKYRENQGEHKKDGDHVLLVQMYQQSHELFYFTGPVDRDRIEISQLLRDRTFAQADRKAAFQRFEARLIGQIFLREDLVPEMSVKDIVLRERYVNELLQQLSADEDERTKDLGKKVKELEVFQKLFEPIKGVGPVLAASLMVAIGDPRRFMVKPDPEVYEPMRKLRNDLAREGRYDEDKEAAYTWLRNSRDSLKREGKYKQFIDAQNFPSNLPYHEKLAAVAKFKLISHKEEEADKLMQSAEMTRRLCKMQRDARNKSMAKMCAFCGVHVLKGGKYEDVPAEKQFPRRRSGVVCNWSPMARQALYLLADQFNRRPDSVWGQKLRAQKETLRQKHPEVEMTTEGKKRYTNGHIHKMAIWKTLNKFVRWLYREWVELEEQIAAREMRQQKLNAA